MAMMKKAVLAAALVSSGLVSTTGMALAGTEHGGDDAGSGATVQKGVVNSSDFAPNTTGDACGNDVPVNVLGVQVPVQDNAAGVPVGSKAGEGNGAANAKKCSNPIHAIN
ncbi:hypothetical protein LQ327_25925 [Actinomycetospora endophytica]|uniref:Small secreted domain DUF320 n=1 Tax=Actinomycetospora endophytica TaxID=2291215 RepID=A0ABS8PEX4_9PSEU|nr:hypothetical protein [Actinomycetospora endophytica]MCD2196814.1 hypothetical protein [Actinomycetospora endophytica]